MKTFKEFKEETKLKKKKKTTCSESSLDEAVSPDDLRVASHNWNVNAEKRGHPMVSKYGTRRPENIIQHDKDIPSGYQRDKETNIIHKLHSPEEIEKRSKADIASRGYGQGRNMGD